MWRGGHPGDGMDTLIAGASVLPMANREALARLVGRGFVREHWERFIGLPFVQAYRGGYYGLFPRLREDVAQTVQKDGPWTWEQCLRTVTTDTLRRTQTGAIPIEQAWGLMARVVRPRLGESLFSVGDEEIPAGEDRPSVMRASPQDGELVVQRPDWASHPPDGLAQGIFQIAYHLYRYRRIVWMTDEGAEVLAPFLRALRFEPLPEHRWQLDLTNTPFTAWLESVVASPVGRRPRDPVAIVQSALLGLRDGREEFGSEVDTYWKSMAHHSLSFRVWFLDALNSLDWGDRVDGKTLLVLYYLERRGIHEELAELFHVSRATDFRNHRSALERLAQAVFG